MDEASNVVVVASSAKPCRDAVVDFLERFTVEQKEMNCEDRVFCVSIVCASLLARNRLSSIFACFLLCLKDRERVCHAMS